jgi:spore germination protein YaaH
MFFGSEAEQITSVTNTHGAVQTLAPLWLDIGSGGVLDSSQINPILVLAMHHMGVRVTPVLSNHYNQANGIAALANTEALTTQLADLVDTYNFDGLQVDLENLTPTQQSALTTFVQTLRSKLSADKELSVAVAANPNNYTTDVYGSYNYAALAQHADYLAIMTYDESYEGSAPGSVASLAFMLASLDYALNTCGVDPHKIVLGLPFYGRIWGVGNTLFTGQGVRNSDILQIITDYGASVTFDDMAKSAKAEFTVTPSSPPHTVEGIAVAPGQYVIWFENHQSYEAKLALVRQYDLLGAATWALGQEDPAIWNYYAQWLNGPPTYTVTYQANWPNGIAGTGSVPTDSQEYLENNSVGVLANPNNLSRPGFLFLGWDPNPLASTPTYVVSDSTVNPASFLMGNANVVLYAIWETLPTYNVIYSSNGATNGSVPSDNLSYLQGDPITIQANPGNLTKTFHTFLGWDPNALTTNPTYAVSDNTVTPPTTVMGSTNLVLFAIWTLNPEFSVMDAITYIENGFSTGNYICATNPATAQESAWANGFTGNGDIVEAAKFLVTRVGTSIINVELKARLYAASSANPPIPTTLLAESAPVLFNTISNTPSWVTFQFDGTCQTLPATSYYIVLVAASGLLSNNPNADPRLRIHQINGPTGINGGYVLRYYSNTWWNLGSTSGILFQVIGSQVPGTHTVNYEANWPSGTPGPGSVPIDNNHYPENSSVTVLANPGSLSRMGYRFLGWDQNPTVVTPSYAVEDLAVVPPVFLMGPTHVVLYAIWQRVFSVRYEAGFPPQALTPTGSVPLDPNGYAPGESLTVLSNTGEISAVNYALIGWQITYTTSSGTTVRTSYFNKTTGAVAINPIIALPADLTGDIFLTGLWRQLYQVNYSANFPLDTSTSGTSPLDLLWYSPSVWVGIWPADTVEVLGNLGDLAAVGYAFLGWDPDPGAVAPVYVGGSVFSQPVYAVMLFAIWKQIAHRVTYHVNGADSGSVPVDLGLYEEAQSVLVLANLGGLARIGHRLLGWAFSALAEVPDFGLFGSVVVPSGFSMADFGVGLFAVWEQLELPPEPDTFTVTYHANFPVGTLGTGTVPLDNHRYLKGSPVTLLANIGELAAAEHRLLGWSILPDASMPMFEISGAGVLPSSFHIGANVVLYAVWQSLVVVPPVCGGLFDGNIFDWALFDVDGTPSGSGDLFDGDIFDCQIFDVPCPPSWGDMFDGDLFDCKIFDVPCPPEPPKPPYVFGDLDYVKMLTKLNLIDSIRGEDRAHHDVQLVLALLEANFWIEGLLSALAAEKPYKAPDMLHHIASHYAAGTFLERDQALNEVHHWKQTALDMMTQYLAAAYGVDLNNLVDLQPSIVVVGNRYGASRGGS